MRQTFIFLTLKIRKNNRRIEGEIIMNIVFWLLAVLVIIILWFFISFMFIPLGRVLLKKWYKTLEILNKEEQKEKEKKHE